ncbi:MAG: lysylphosphatidylglycerol synthase transmembrane domain-containing protein [Marinilabiliales bacterium]
MSKVKDYKALKRIRPTRIILPILLGLIGIGLLMYFDKNFKLSSFSLININLYLILFVIVSFLMMMTRDIGYMLRLRILTDKFFNWRKTFNIIMLWEFASAVSPGAIGGTGVAVIFITKEGLPVGKSAAVVMATSLLDELYFILMFPALLIAVGFSDLFSIGEKIAFDITNKYFIMVLIAYSIKFVWVLFISYGLFKNPGIVKKFIVGIFNIKFLRKWKNKAEKAGDDMILASKELKTKSFSFWLKAFTATFLSWTARYWVLNFLLIALIFGIPDVTIHQFPTFADHFLIFARQLVMWIMMLILPTPGGSGIIELIFSDYMAEFIPVAGLISIMAIMWRIVTYYPYLFMGVFVLPKWVNRVFKKNKANA